MFWKLNMDYEVSQTDHLAKILHLTRRKVFSYYFQHEAGLVSFTHF